MNFNQVNASGFRNINCVMFSLHSFLDLTPCISPLPYCTVVLDKSSPSPKKEETEISGVRKLFGEANRVIEDTQSNVYSV